MLGFTNFVLAVLAAATLGFAAPLDVRGHGCNHTSVNSTGSDHGHGYKITPLNSTVAHGYTNTTDSSNSAHVPCHNMTAAGNTTTLTNNTSQINGTGPCNNMTTSSSTTQLNETTPANSTKSLGFFDWLFDPLTGTVNFYSRPDCQNPCISTLFCAPGNGDLRGDRQSYDWSQDDGVACWDRPSDTHSIGLVAGGHGVGKGYAGVTVSCAEAVRDWGNGVETRELSWGEGGFVEKQECNAGGNLSDDVKAVVFVGKGKA